jgi:hypothetical protein
MRKEIVLMTKSLKDRGYCVAGIDLQTKQWIRLVSSTDGDAIEKEVLDNDKIQELDTIKVEVIKPTPHKCHTEDWLLDLTAPIIKTGSLSLDQVIKLRPLDNNATLYGNTKGELTADEIKLQKHSLEMVSVSNVIFDTAMKGDGRNHHHITFNYNGSKHDCSLTDPKVRNEKLDGFPIPKAYLIVSIPKDPYGENETYKKFVAKIFVRL